MSVRITNHTKYQGRAFGRLWSTVLRQSYHEVLPKGRGGAVLAEKEETARKLGGRVPSTHDGIVGRYQRLCELGVRIIYSVGDNFGGYVDNWVELHLPHGQIQTGRVLRRLRFMAYAELLGGRDRVPAGISDNTWSTVTAAEQTFPALVKQYGPELVERVPKVRTPKQLSPSEKLAAKLAGLDAREKAWRTKAKRAATALKTIARERKRIERKLNVHNVAVASIERNATIPFESLSRTA